MQNIKGEMQNVYLLSPDELRKGDIFLTTENSIVSKIVRTTTKSDFSHAILYVGNSSYIHSDGMGVHSGNLQRLCFNSQENVVVLRVTNDIKILDKVEEFARSKIGTAYSTKGAVNAKLKLNNKKYDNRQFCSRLVAQSYEYAGINLVKDALFCTPQEILDSKEIQKLPIVPNKASDEEINFINSENPIKRQSEITNNILSEVRRFTKKDIQSLGEILNYIIKHPEHDKGISHIYKMSGYFNMFDNEIKNNPWRYDVSQFRLLPYSNAEFIQLATNEKNGAQESLKRFGAMYSIFLNLNKIYKLEFIELNIKLYRQLVENALKNIQVAEEILG